MRKPWTDRGGTITWPWQRVARTICGLLPSSITTSVRRYRWEKGSNRLVSHSGLRHRLSPGIQRSPVLSV